ncbi:MAG: carboxymuconolactone decarboxylase family protein [Myxococcota bacterium]|nr:carboxymuconolactone decarboxylase family protein [Myxococcota bacterium]
MPRLKQISRSEAPADIAKLYDLLFDGRDPVAEPGTETGTPGNWWTVFAVVPDLFRHAVAGFQFYRSPKRKIDPKLRELGQTRAGYLRGSQFVFSQHCKAMRSVGFAEESIEGIPGWQTADCFSPIERAVLAYTDALVQDGGRVPDATFDALKATLSDEAILELTYITCTYDLHATMCRALRLEYDDVDERIVEIPSPGSGGSVDMMRSVDGHGEE